MKTNIILFVITSFCIVREVIGCHKYYENRQLVIKCTNISEDIIERISKISIQHFNNVLITENSNFTSLNPIRTREYIKHVIVINNTAHMDADAFDDFRALKTLTITGSNMPIFRGFLISTWKALDLLNFTNNNIEKFRYGSLCLKQAYKVILKNNKIDTLENIFDKVCSPLQYLDVSYNNIHNFSIEIFSPLPALETLNLSYNKLTLIESKNSNETIQTKLRELYINNNNLSSLSEDVFKYLTDLETLTLHDNPLLILGSKTFNIFPRFTRLRSLSINNIKTLEANFLNHTNLRVLNITGDLEDIEEDAFEGLPKVRELNLQKNQLTTLRKRTFKGLKELNTINLNENLINTIEPEAFSGVYLSTVSLKTNQMSELKANIFSGLVLSYTLDLSDQNIGLIEQGALNHVLNNDLQLNHNEIDKLPCKMSEKEASGMRILNFGHNNIATIDICAFREFPKVEELFLNNNQLTHLRIGLFSPLKWLEKLNIAHNHFKQLGASLLYPLVSLEKVELGANPWDCEKFASLLIFLSGRKISVESQLMPVYDFENIDGIGCVPEKYY